MLLVYDRLNRRTVFGWARQNVEFGLTILVRGAIVNRTKYC